MAVSNPTLTDVTPDPECPPPLEVPHFESTLVSGSYCDPNVLSQLWYIAWINVFRFVCELRHFMRIIDIPGVPPIEVPQPPFEIPEIPGFTEKRPSARSGRLRGYVGNRFRIDLPGIQPDRVFSRPSLPGEQVPLPPIQVPGLDGYRRIVRWIEQFINLVNDLQLFDPPIPIPPPPQNCDERSPLFDLLPTISVNHPDFVPPAPGNFVPGSLVPGFDSPCWSIVTNGEVIKVGRKAIFRPIDTGQQAEIALQCPCGATWNGEPISFGCTVVNSLATVKAEVSNACSATTPSIIDACAGMPDGDILRRYNDTTGVGVWHAGDRLTIKFRICAWDPPTPKGGITDPYFVIGYVDPLPGTTAGNFGKCFGLGCSDTDEHFIRLI